MTEPGRLLHRTQNRHTGNSDFAQAWNYIFLFGFRDCYSWSCNARHNWNYWQLNYPVLESINIWNTNFINKIFTNSVPTIHNTLCLHRKDRLNVPQKTIKCSQISSEIHKNIEIARKFPNNHWNIAEIFVRLVILQAVLYLIFVLVCGPFGSVSHWISICTNEAKRV
jgi:hypothetical protein